MLKGDLAATPLPEVLRTLAGASSTGCLRVTAQGPDARVFLRDGLVHAVVLPGRRPQLGPRLVSSGELSPAALAEAYDAQATELQGWRLGELLVHLGYVEQDVVEAAAGEALREAAFELLLRTSGTWRFRPGERTREDVAAPVPVEDLLADLALITPAWDALRARVHGPDAVPLLSAAGTSPETLTLDGDAWSLLCSVDGTSTLSALAASSGLSLLEAAEVVVTLLDAGLVEMEPVAAEVAEVEPAVVEPVVEPAVDESPVDEPAVVQPVVEPAEVEPVVDESPVDEPVVPVTVAAPAEPAAIASRLAEALRGLGPMPVLPPLPDLADLPEMADLPELPAAADEPAMASTAMDGESLTRALAPRIDDALVTGSISRASQSLQDSLGESTEPFDPFALPLTAARGAALPPLDERAARRRALDAQDLADRHAELEAERAAERERDEQRRAARAAMTALLNDAPAPTADPATADTATAEHATAEHATAEPDTPAADADAVEPPADDDAHLHGQWQAAAFAELSAAAGAVPPAVPAPEPQPEPAPQPVPVEARDDDPAPAPPRGADTAALLRELSSLGLEDDLPPQPVPEQRAAVAPAVRPPAPAAAKKRKGLFGRG